ncbi:MAG: glycosyltransferase family 39 protein [Deltaproteobacteria bacterium]|nr:glycosyltransferase family 39 protein [Deltaproteobacteria bacterium]
MNGVSPTNRFPKSDMAIPVVLVAARIAAYFLIPEPYGYFRDELYYLACADHLDWGYVDHPPFSIFVLAIIRFILGDSLVALRLIPLVAICGTALLTARLARELGGGLYAAALASLATLLTPVYLAHSSFYSMNALEVFFYALAFLGSPALGE